ncbi:hypothetical protein [Streptomyces sp. NPDC048425]|uniref:hypothetical protein n=1 Tax=Streptomyces sp. NPDC048425 TaxID=3365548 RepID=UPI0037157968
MVEGEPQEVLAAAQAAADAPDGIGTIASYATEVALSATGTWKSPGLSSARANAVVTAPEHRMPLLFIEADNCHEDAVTIAAKFDRHLRFYQCTVKDTAGGEALSSTRWEFGADLDRDPLLPILPVFSELGARSPRTQMRNIAALTRHHWEGQVDHEGAFHTYGGKIPIVATQLDAAARTRTPRQGVLAVRQKAPGRPVERGQQPSPRLSTLRQRVHAERERQVQEKQQAALEAVRREEGRPSCVQCGEKLTDDSWHATVAFPEPDHHWRAGLCEP